MIGIDIETIGRIEYLLENKPRIIRKLFTDYEWEYSQKKATKPQTLTGIWCGKEAVVKAFSNIENIPVNEVEIRHTSSGAPYIFFVSNQRLMREYDIHISISHSREYATAVAVISHKKENF